MGKEGQAERAYPFRIKRSSRLVQRRRGRRIPTCGMDLRAVQADMKILVDADACPKSVLRICMDLGRKYDIPVWTVSSFNHRIESDHHIIVGTDPQEADIKTINLTEAGDVIITQDWGLAAVVIGKEARCVSPAGREFLHNRMAFMLEEREMKARFRRRGGRTRGPKKRTSEDDRRFESSLERILSEQIGKTAG